MLGAISPLAMHAAAPPRWSNVADCALDGLFGDMGLDAFRRSVFGQELLHAPGTIPSSGFTLLSYRELCALASRLTLDHRRARLYRSGKPHPGMGVDRPLTPAEVRDAVADGYTFVVNAVDEVHAGVGELNRMLEGAFGVRVQTNAYLTPPGARGFAPHADGHHVLVLQVEGSKRWFIGPPRHDSDGRWIRHGHPDTEVLRQQVTTREIVALAGDVLHVPRGWVHWAETDGDQRSLHLTVGLRGISRAAVVEEALRDLLARSPALDPYLPTGWVFDDDAASTHAHVDEIWTELRDELPAALERALERFRERFFAKRAAGPVDLVPVHHTVSAHSVLAPTRGLRMRLYRKDRRAHLQAGRTKLDCPLEYAPVLERLSHGDARSAADWLAGVDPDDGLSLLQHLVDHGVLVLADRTA